MGPAGADERLFVGDELDQVARDETRRKTEVAQDVYEEPGAVAAGALSFAERLLGGEDARLHAHDVSNERLNLLVEADQLVDRAHPVARDAGEQVVQQRPRRIEAAERGQFVVERRVVGERPGFGFGFEKEVERIDGGHVGHEVDGHIEMGDALGEDDAGEEIALGILLPVQEVSFR